MTDEYIQFGKKIKLKFHVTDYLQNTPLSGIRFRQSRFFLSSLTRACHIRPVDFVSCMLIFEMGQFWPFNLYNFTFAYDFPFCINFIFIPASKERALEKTRAKESIVLIVSREKYHTNRKSVKNGQIHRMKTETLNF